MSIRTSDLSFEAVRAPAAALGLKRAALWALLVSKIVTGWGVQWDIQWHVLIGRDSFWIPPHLITYAGVSAAVFLSFGMLFWETGAVGEMRAINVIRVRNDRNVVANWAVAELAPVASSTFLYGTLRVPALTGEHLSGAERQALADTPLTRALQAWVEQLLSQISLEIQRAQASRDTTEDREAANDALRRLRELMREYLRPSGGENGGREFGSIIHEITLEPGKNELALAVGTVVPLVFKCYERDRDRRLPILKPRVHMVADPVGVVSFNGFSSITALAPGTCKARLENLEGTVRSNEVTIKTIEVSVATLADPGRELKQGEIIQLDVRMDDPHGVAVEGAIYEISIDELDMGRVKQR